VLEHFLRGRSAHTLDAYKRDLDSFAGFLGVSSAREATKLFLALDGAQANRATLSWLQSMTEAKLASSTRARRLAALRSLAKVGRLLGAIAWTIEVESPRVQRYRDTAGCGMAAVRKMATACEHPRDRAALLLLGTLAIRRRGLLNLRIRDYDAERRRVYVRDKGDKERWMKLPEVTARAIEAWLALHPDRDNVDAPIICGLKDGRALTPQAVNYIVEQAGKRVGVRAWPHGVRHSVASKFAKDKRDVRDIMQLLGHSDVRNTMRYIDAAEDPTEEMSQMLGDWIENDEL
jgi:integrase/recombinase XerC